MTRFSSTCKTLHVILDETDVIWKKLLSKENSPFYQDFLDLATFSMKNTTLYLSHNCYKLAVIMLKGTAKKWFCGVSTSLDVAGGQYQKGLIENKSTFFVPTVVAKHASQYGITTLAFNLWDVRTQKVSGLFQYTWNENCGIKFHLYNRFVLLQKSRVYGNGGEGEVIIRLNIDFDTCELVEIWQKFLCFPKKNVRDFSVFEHCIVAITKIEHKDAPLDCQVQNESARDGVSDDRSSDNVDTDDDDINLFLCSHRKMTVYSVETGQEISSVTFMSYCRKDVHDLRNDHNWIVLYGKPHLFCHNFVTKCTKNILILDGKNRPLLFGDMKFKQGKVVIRRGMHYQDDTTDWQLVDINSGEVIWRNTVGTVSDVISFDEKTNDGIGYGTEITGQLTFISSKHPPTKIKTPDYHIDHFEWRVNRDDNYCMFGTLPRLMSEMSSNDFYVRVDVSPKSHWCTDSWKAKSLHIDWHISPFFVAVHLVQELNQPHQIRIVPLLY